MPLTTGLGATLRGELPTASSRHNCSEQIQPGNHFPIDTVANVVDLWTWTGEFVAACTRLGQMPVLYQSYGLPGGPERGKKYQGGKFHDDLSVKPIASGVLGREYLDQIQRMLARINETQMPKILQAARWWSEVPKASATTLVTGHMFPRHAQDPRTLQISDFAAVPAWENKELLDAGHPPAFVLCLGYQFAPQKLLDQAKALGVKLVYIASVPATIRAGNATPSEWHGAGLDVGVRRCTARTNALSPARIGTPASGVPRLSPGSANGLHRHCPLPATADKMPLS